MPLTASDTVHARAPTHGGRSESEIDQGGERSAGDAGSGKAALSRGRGAGRGLLVFVIRPAAGTAGNTREDQRRRQRAPIAAGARYIKWSRRASAAAPSRTSAIAGRSDRPHAARRAARDRSRTRAGRGSRARAPERPRTKTTNVYERTARARKRRPPMPKLDEPGDPARPAPQQQQHPSRGHPRRRPRTSPRPASRRMGRARDCVHRAAHRFAPPGPRFGIEVVRGVGGLVVPRIEGGERGIRNEEGGHARLRNERSSPYSRPGTCAPRAGEPGQPGIADAERGARGARPGEGGRRQPARGDHVPAAGGVGVGDGMHDGRAAAPPEISTTNAATMSRACGPRPRT